LLGGPGFSPIRPLIPTLFEPMGRSEPDQPLPLGVFSATTSPIAAAHDPLRSDLSVPPAPPVETGSVTAPPTPDARPVHVTQTPVHQTIEVHATTQHLYTDHRPAAAVSGRRTVESAVPPAEPVAAQHKPAVIVQPSAAPAGAAGSKTVTTVHHHETVLGRADVQREPRRRPRAAEPDVHISIGRVEIRAGQDGKAARQRADSRKSPRLSLEDYLRGREADRR
jgi:hypothetical protein